MLKIGDFSRLSNISVRMLRYYDEINLLKPITIDSSTGYRYYNANQLVVINQISRYKELGISLDGIKEILDNNGHLDFIKKFMKSHVDELNEERKKLEKQISLMENAMNNLGKDDGYLQYAVVLKTIPKREVVSLRKKISSRGEEGTLWVELNEEINKQKISLSKDCHSLALYYDNEYRDTDIDVEIQTAVISGGKDNENIKFFTAPELKVVSVTFRGSYEQRPHVSRAIADWIETSEYVMDGPMISIFYITPHQSSNPDNWITEVCYTVRKK